MNNQSTTADFDEGRAGPATVGIVEPTAAVVEPDLTGTARGPYGVYVTLLIGLVFLCAQMDRNNLAILLVPIQKDLGVSDTAMGVLAGTAFSVVYALAALPLARWADVGNRRNIIALSVGVWSAMTAACGLANSYYTMLLARIGVATGEAGSSPAAISMIGDLYPRHRRGIAMAITQIGGATGVGLGAWIAGSLADAHGWRMSFFVMGIPGLAFALLLFLTMREPPRGVFEKVSGRPPTALRSLGYIFSVPTIRSVLAGKIILNLATGGLFAWVPAFFMRIHGLSASEMSKGFGLSLSLGVVVAALFSGLLTDRLARSGERWRFYFCGISILVGAPFVAATMLAPTPGIAFVCFFLSTLCSGGLTSTTTVGALAVVRPDVRGTMAAVINLCVSLIGFGMGPMLFGYLNDYFRVEHGDAGIRYTMLLVPVLWVVSSVFFAMAGRTTDRDAARAQGLAG